MRSRTSLEPLALLEAVASDHPTQLRYCLGVILASPEQVRLRQVASRWDIQVHQLDDVITGAVSQIDTFDRRRSWEPTTGPVLPLLQLTELRIERTDVRAPRQRLERLARKLRQQLDLEIARQAVARCLGPRPLALSSGTPDNAA